ncbi:MAG: type II toxin-antitoxin system prevent-host-death family antitoxin [Chitinophagaceae bacterium]|nr:MAG: type II toxin-antitoxin system prevent-host-death family antitoxin [Chitinophagaceae bacterium]
METLTIGEFKAHFSEVLKKVQEGKEVAISYGKKKEIVARLVPKATAKKTARKLGMWDKKGRVIFHSDFKMTEEEMLGL